ncbi:MAG TPA: SAM-dependent methyltransferase [Micropepsaceae bacterium]|nr:SAM-dependent methyltransferase [Micropepsaceae bacterium]
MPPRALRYALLNQVKRWFKTGDKRFEFERLYLENPDPWDLRSCAYEREKYRRTLDKIVEQGRSAERVLEVGCSVGSFTAMLAEHFAEVVAVDFSDEAIARAAEYCRGATNIRFIRSDLQSLKLDTGFDVIVCAEILYYIEKPRAQTVCTQLKRLLAPNGIIAMVGAAEGKADFWENILTREFRPVRADVIADDIRPYKIVLFEHS